jgi:hypothetical protein
MTHENPVWEEDKGGMSGGGIEHAAFDLEPRAELEVATSDLVARMSNHVADLTRNPVLSLNGHGSELLEQIESLRAEEKLPASAVEATTAECGRARAGGVLHALERFESGYRANLASGERPQREAESDLLCLDVSHQAADMDFVASRQTMAAKTKEIEGSGQVRDYWEGVLNTLRIMVRSVEICLEDVVLNQVAQLEDEVVTQLEDPHAAERRELSSLLFVALTSATPERLERALGSATFDEKLMSHLLDAKFLTKESPLPAMHINPDGAGRARELLSTIAETASR